ncbi:uncharacterized protein LOC112088548 [Eutrema salsugineum]|uniref:uncharacterized protein LOC112088548 n=1 Tax=Eutrema salsugineum TaxID=72664 RepID=UPI000CED4398|nr:uncharacterized protein LOC112088548 [Eutrema salsugineum]
MQRSPSSSPIQLSIQNYFPLRFYKVLCKMGDNLRRAIQDLDLGANDEPIVLPIEVIHRAENENRFIIMGCPTIPRRQNLRSIVASLPRLWGIEGMIHGRIVAGRRFQFVFPTEESMENVLRRGPWAFADRMLVLQRWTPLMDLEIMQFIPFWIQIRGIPWQFMNQDVVAHIGRAIGMLMDINYNTEAVARAEYVRVRINWDIRNPLCFQRQFQFTPGENTLLSFCYERLRGFCDVFGLITHDSGSCLVQNGGEEYHSDGDDDDEEPPQADHQHNGNGIRIQEINDEEADAIRREAMEANINQERPNGIQDDQNDGEEVMLQDPNEDSNEETEKEEEETCQEDEYLWDEWDSQKADVREWELKELYNPVPIFSNSTGDVLGRDLGKGEMSIAEQELMRDYEAFGGTPSSIPVAENGTRKRKFPVPNTEKTANKVQIRELGESSGTSPEEAPNTT